MIFKESCNYELVEPLLKITNYCTAINDSIVVIGLVKNGEESLFHYDKHSKLLFKYDFGQFVMSLCMPTPDTALVLIPEDKHIAVFHLPTKTYKFIEHSFTTQEGCQAFLDYFCETSLLCIRENGDHDDVRMKLAYYSWPFPLNNEDTLQPVVVFEADQNQWDPSYEFHKTNAHSQYIWHQSRQKEEFVISIHEIVHGQSVFSRKEISMKGLYQPYKMSSMEASIVEMWQFQPRVILLFCTSTKNEQKAVNPETGVVNNTFLWDLSQDTIRETKFTFPIKYHDLQVDNIGCSSFSMFHTFYFEPGKRVPSPVYYINNNLEIIIDEEEWTCSHLQKFEVDPRENNTIIEATYQEWKPTSIKVRVLSLCSRREMSLFLLSEMKDVPEGFRDSWDYNFICDIFKVLDYGEKQ